MNKMNKKTKRHILNVCTLCFYHDARGSINRVRIQLGANRFLLLWSIEIRKRKKQKLA